MLSILETSHAIYPITTLLFAGFAAVGLLLLIVKVVLLLCGVGFDLDVDHHDGEEGILPISILTVAVGATTFGLGGLCSLAAAGLSPLLAIPCALISAVIVLWMTQKEIQILTQLKHPGADYSLVNAVGKTGCSYFKMEPRGSGVVFVTFSGSRRQCDAINCSDLEIPGGVPVLIIGQEGNALLVKAVTN